MKLLYNPALMRRLSLFLFVSLGSLLAGEQESKPIFPLWDSHESVADYAKKVNLPPTKTLDLGNGLKMELVLIPAGKFVMGVSEPEIPKVSVPKTDKAWKEYLAAKWQYDSHYGGEKPGHSVTITQPFYMGKFVVSQEQYQEIMGTNPSHFKNQDNPVESVSWNNAQEFCKKLTVQSSSKVRLPTEAEWEFSCRAGKTTDDWSGEAIKELDRLAWYEGNSKQTTHPVGKREPNSFGLYDMRGNVCQWCQDWFAVDYYIKSPTEDPQGPANAVYPEMHPDARVFRGGSYRGLPYNCRSTFRDGGPSDFLSNRPDFLKDWFGFRVVVPASKSP